MPHGRALGTDVVGGTKLCNLVVAFVFNLVNHGLELVILEVFLSLAITVIGLLFLVLLRIHGLVNFGAILVFQDFVAVHVIENLTALATHIVGHLLAHIFHLLGSFVSRVLSRLVVQLEGEGELGELDVCVEIIQPLEIAAVLALGLRLVTARENVRGAHLFGLQSFAL